MLSEPVRSAAKGQGESKHLVFMRAEHHYYVYIMQSTSRQALYIGVTGNLQQRVFEHKSGKIEGFTSQYRAHRLVYFEQFHDIHGAIAREKQLKGWRRSKKEALIHAMNPHWSDLSEGWFKT